ncbi:MAG TPA: hypothetical protein VJG48_01875 [Candidatus Paceibacterota bacterium]
MPTKTIRSKTQNDKVFEKKAREGSVSAREFKRVVGHGYEALADDVVIFEKYCGLYDLDQSEALQYLAQNDPLRFARAVFVQMERRGTMLWRIRAWTNREAV